MDDFIRIVYVCMVKLYYNEKSRWASISGCWTSEGSSKKHAHTPHQQQHKRDNMDEIMASQAWQSEKKSALARNNRNESK